MVMKGGGRGVTLLSSGEGGTCDVALRGRGCGRLQRFPMHCRFQGILST
jgi:hypothetical protein